MCRPRDSLKVDELSAEAEVGKLHDTYDVAWGWVGTAGDEIEAWRGASRGTPLRSEPRLVLADEFG
eukprot:3001513-Pyramimonas_sp.AAC.1